ncbi:MAG: type II toxin-antitoxin system ParD family antitoxin [Methylobacterium sp.]|uniref:type II toxin-antitoxin system ParD family antitoxin n=1 Tax=Methylobacterium sp. TaxID=409 RepID=UPI0025871E61|nr:type II toxin-antitoxin system ParD family antitoxin [Methylobacterium sp.]MBY0296595.1 type II toxin-antitoxin system ParD family antitoxin [Methylobacterium sp.]
MITRQSRNVSLTPELETFIADRLASGDYANASEVVRAGLRALRDGPSSPHRPLPKGWPAGGGECGALIRERDWSRTVLGSAETWSPEMRATVSNIVNSPIPQVLMWGPHHVMLYNDAYREIAHAHHPRALGGTVPEIWPEIWDWNRAVLEAGFRGEPSSFRDQPMVLRRDGRAEAFTFDLFYTPVYEADGRVGGVKCTVLDNSARAEAERRLAASNRRFRTAMDAVHGVLWTNSADGRMVGEQPGWAALTGQTPEEYEGFGWAKAVHPDDAADSVATWNAAVAAKAMYVHEHRVRHHGGAWRVFAIRALPILDEAGGIVEWVGVHTDITHQRAAEAALRAQAEDLARQVRHRERAETQLRLLNETLEARVIAEIDERRRAEAKLAQAQKMEAIGKLTGGVAHDFNNLLQVVSGNLQLLARDVAGQERAERRVANAMAGVSRGAKLASQLLAFGRRQALEPKVVNVTRFVRDMDDMLRRAIGEAVEIETVFAGGLWNTFIDPGQIENALLNLAINARDAMDGRGKLTIELANAHLDDAYARDHDDVAPGQYVMLAVSDTGCGMPPEVVAKVFEPFFTTKAEGKGSGLGLSMVYGFVKQSGGHVKIYSEVGHGTTIRLYLPRAQQTEDVPVAVETGPVTGGSETVLVVEDDAEVRATVVELLADLGYRVLKAVDATSALNVIESGIPIDLLFTDVVMPGTLKSPELARKARERLPGLAVLFTSGYTENAIVHGGRLDTGVELLSKPYTREALARKIRHVLANQRQRAVFPAPPAPAPAAVAPPAGEGATLLLVEDDALIRANTAEMLQEAGYVVVEAGSAEEAMAVLQTAPVDVLVTDVNLPGASGRELAARARTVRPAVVVVYATGDTHAVREEAGARLLPKPYDAVTLLTVIAAARHAAPGRHVRAPQAV